MQPSRRPRRSQDAPSATHEKRPLTDFSGILLIGIGTLIFLSLVSFSPDDLPSWIPWSRRPIPLEQGTNLLGPLGTVISGYMIFLFGPAAFFLPVGLIWFGISKLLMRLRLLWIPTLGFCLIMFCTSTFFAVQTFAFQDWGTRFQILGSGGGIGYLGNEMAQRSIGVFAMGFLSIIGTLLGTVMLFGLRPRQALYLFQDWLLEFRENRALARKAGAEADLEEERAAFDFQRGITRTAQPAGNRRRNNRQSDQDLVIPGSEVAAALSEQELPLGYLDTGHSELNAFGPPVQSHQYPGEPEIIDGTARKAEVDDPSARKMSLAEWRQKRRPVKSSPEDSTPTSSGMASALRGLSEAYRDYQLPDLDILHWDDVTERKPADKGLLLATQQIIIRTLANFGVNVTPGTITRGPSITRYEIYPSDGLRVQKIVTLEPDLARATKAEFINILAPIPGKDTVGIEIANSDKVAVPLRELLEDPKFHKGKARLPLALGKDVYGETIIADLASMPHLLVAGTTGSGKSVCINSIIASLLFQFGPDQLRFIMVDPKVVEMQIFNDLPHLIVPVVTDPKKVLAALKWCVNEMEHRYRMFAKEGVRNFEGFNGRKHKGTAATSAITQPKRSAMRRSTGAPEPELPLFDPLPEGPTQPLVVHPVRIDDKSQDDPFATIDDSELESRATFAAELGQTVDEYYEEDVDDAMPIEDVVPETVPYIVVIVDELADLMQTASADVENLIARLTQKARAAGIHLIVATQTPRANVITGVIKANIPSRIAFQVASGLDSRVILDGNGAEKLVGKGDMLYLPPGTSKLTRAQGAFITDEEMTALVDHCKAQGKPMYDSDIQAVIRAASEDEEEAADDELTGDDIELMERCIEVILQEKIASTSRLQRRLKLGYTRAARMMDILEKRGIVGPGEGAKPREILISADDYAEN